jgi:RNA polymerase sigma-70 factor (ECF subfamily)
LIPSLRSLWSSLRAEPDSFEALLRPHVDYLYRLAFRFCGNRDDAEDLVQDLLIKLYDRREEIAALDKPRPWLARALYRLYVDRWRRAERSPIVAVEDVDLPEEDAPARPGPATELESHWTRERLQTALQALNPDQRALLMLHDVEGYTLSELEEVLATPIGTLKSRLHRARAAMRGQLMEPLSDGERVEK